MNRRGVKLALFGLTAGVFGVVLVLAGLVNLLYEALPEIANGPTVGGSVNTFVEAGVVVAGVGLVCGFVAMTSRADEASGSANTAR